MSTEKPFAYGTQVSGNLFTDREDETARLKNNFLYGINTILISPRRYGKTSLVNRVCEELKTEDVRIARLDIFGCRSQEEFLDAFATAIIKTTSTRWEEWMENLKQFLSRLVPKVHIGTDPFHEFSISLDYQGVQGTAEEILDLPETIAQHKGYRIVVCIDEFQQLGSFSDSLAFQKLLRSRWQLQKKVSYCMFGSKKTMMESIFSKPNYPFYKFGDLLYLSTIELKKWVDFIVRRFDETGKNIRREIAEEIVTTVQAHSSYVQQLSWLVWINTKKTATQDTFKVALDTLLRDCEPLFVNQTENLPKGQMNLLRAIANGAGSGLTRQETMRRYNLGVSANIVKSKKALIDRDLLFVDGKSLRFCDPILALWLCNGSH